MAKKEGAKVQEGQTVELPTAKELMKQIAQKEAEKASEYMRREAAGQAEKKALIERLSKPSGVSDEEALRRAMAIIQRAAFKRIDGSSGPSVPEQSLYGWWSCYQQLGGGLGKHTHWARQGNVSVLGEALTCQGIPVAVPDRGFSQGDAW